MRIEFTANVFREGGAFVSYAPELDVSSCGATWDEARKNLDEAARLFLEAALESQMLTEVLEERGYTRSRESWLKPEFLSTEPAGVEIPLEHAET